MFFLFIIVLGAQLITLNAQTTEAVKLQNEIKEFRVVYNNIEDEHKQQIKNIEDDLLANATAIEQAKYLSRQIKLLQDRIVKLEERNQVLQESNGKLLSERYKVGKKVLESIIKGTAFVTGLSQFTSLEQKINIQTSVWNNEKFRDNWDKLKDYSSELGLLGSGAALIAKSSPETALIAGLAGMMIPGLLDKIFGKDETEAINNSFASIKKDIEFINFTRSAYDGLKLRSTEIHEIYQKDSTLLADLRKFDNEYLTEEKSDSIKGNKLFMLRDKIVLYENIYEQLPNYLKRLLETIEQYKEHPDLKEYYIVIKPQIENFRKNYEEIYFPILLSISVEDRRMIFDNSSVISLKK